MSLKGQKKFIFCTARSRDFYAFTMTENLLMAGGLAALAYMAWGGKEKARTVREVTMNQSSLQFLNSSSSSGPGTTRRTSSKPEVYMGVTHWVLDVSFIPSGSFTERGI
jgi:hypothetical protein